MHMVCADQAMSSSTTQTPFTEAAATQRQVSAVLLRQFDTLVMMYAGIISPQLLPG